MMPEGKNLWLNKVRYDDRPPLSAANENKICTTFIRLTKHKFKEQPLLHHHWLLLYSVHIQWMIDQGKVVTTTLPRIEKSV